MVLVNHTKQPYFVGKNCANVPFVANSSERLQTVEKVIEMAVCTQAGHEVLSSLGQQTI